MVVKIDKLGRIVIPVRFRQALEIKAGDEIDIDVVSNKIIIQRLFFGCIFCHSAVNLVRIDDLCVCRPCINRLHEAKDGDLLYPISVE